MDTEQIRAIIAKRAVTDDEWQSGVERCWDELANALVEDLQVTREFLLSACTPEECSWVSEVYEEIIERTQSREVVEMLRESIERFPEEDEKYHMTESLDAAAKSSLIA